MYSRKDFVPLPEFTSPHGGHTVLLFVTSFNIRHPTRSDDPIFPARKHITADPTGNPDLDDLLNYWTNDEPHGAVLGCVEFAELCRTASSESCFDPWEYKNVGFLDEETYPPGIGLLHSGFWSTIKTRTSKELNATRMIVDSTISMPLAEDQWKLEAQRLFEMSMIRAKLEVLELARGTRAGMEGFTNQMGHSRRGICQKIKFRSTGYKNISLFGILLALLLPPVLAFSVKGKPVFYLPIYGILILANLPVKERPLIHWPWHMIKTLSNLISNKAPPAFNSCYEALQPARNALCFLCRSFLKLLKPFSAFLRGFMRHSGEGAPGEVSISLHG